ncbi:RsmE family RNA methyltransferase [Salmonirosea aquatica]|uniref:Ribosomal RNA small subunit methyltransferase E n=1 Tax=Salmonirosea aquatica TaxID=2654236 RepID=A0A7C9BI31_9BACT|nr:RsmE family RNA methyltransferase [Cytophagaceae bacterium SJW1-29]
MHVFYQPDNKKHFLETDEAHHCIKVLRARPGDELVVTDGRGGVSKGTIVSINPKRVEYQVRDFYQVPLPDYRIHMAICPTRKAERNEWMVEKMTELGVHKIQFVISEHTHRETMKRVLNPERLIRVALSAMKQSQQFHLPEFAYFLNLDTYLGQVEAKERYIAYVASEDIPRHLIQQLSPVRPVEILIGPEGDFSTAEIEAAQAADFKPVSLGDTRLRTETAAVVACHSAVLAQIQ